MRYVVTVNGTDFELDVDGDVATLPDNVAAARLDASRGTPIRTIRVGDRVIPVVVHARHGKGRVTLDIGGHRYEAEALDERTRAIREMTARTAAPSGPAPVVAPMPGLVVRIAVAVGDQVTAGQGVLVMEAMKMENELRAAADGTVKSVRVTPGTAVEKGSVLIELE
jgi:pyruvate carboxylase subunit B